MQYVLPMSHLEISRHVLCILARRKDELYFTAKSALS